MRKLAILFCLLFVASCAQFQSSEVSPAWTPKQKSTYFMNVYSTQYDQYKIQVKYTDLTEAEKQILRVKKQILTQAYPLIAAYDLIIAEGGTPSVESEQAIFSLIDSLQRQTIRQIK